MTFEHFWHRPQGVKGKRAPSDKFHGVRSCYYHNVDRPPTETIRMRFREYIARYYDLDLERLLKGEYE